LAARYLKLIDDGDSDYIAWDWRDCKEEGDRIRTQMAAIISRFSNDSVTEFEISDISDIDLVDIFISTTKNSSAVFVLDK
jgi:hypothetical protein